MPKLPLRQLLADDPGAGKTTMAGMLIKELAIRGDLERCLIIGPGSLVGWRQHELSEPVAPGSNLTRPGDGSSGDVSQPFFGRVPNLPVQGQLRQEACLDSR
jgi:hypothetical protein